MKTKPAKALIPIVREVWKAVKIHNAAFFYILQSYLSKYAKGVLE